MHFYGGRNAISQYPSMLYHPPPRVQGFSRNSSGSPDWWNGETHDRLLPSSRDRAMPGLRRSWDVAPIGRLVSRTLDRLERLIDEGKPLSQFAMVENTQQLVKRSALFIQGREA